MKHLILLVAAGASVTACSLDNLLNGEDPPDGSIVDPQNITTYTGAIQVYYSAIGAMADGMRTASEDIGLFTDELNVDLTVGSSGMYIDGRTADPSRPIGVYSQAYINLQSARVIAGQAAQLLLKYGDSTARARIGHAYALEAQTIVILAEMYCSGVPLTEVPYGGELRYTAGLSTSQLFERAVALFDTAYSYGRDSLPIATFAQVGKGRALQGLGRYADAAAAVAGVPTGAKYTLEYSLLEGGVRFWSEPGSIGGRTAYRVLSPEGSNGLQWAADSAWQQDPRVPLSKISDSVFTNPIREDKFLTGAVNLIVADGIQARLIEAEAQLQPANAPQGPWLATLNTARATIGLAPLADPGAAAGRVDLLFKERGFWLYLQGHRLGDWRRLVRNYGRLRQLVYTVGAYGHYLIPAYGPEYVFAPPRDEQDLNPLYKGCFDKTP